MPNRILRDWTDSEVVDRLSPKAEVFFTRLIMKADDFGCYHANVKLLKANLYPLRDNMRPSDITPLLQECAAVGLIRTYTVAGKEYLIIVNYGQRLRQSKRKFPEPLEFDKKGHVSDLLTTSREFRPESESETELESETETEEESPQADVNHPPEVLEAFKAFNAWIDTNAPNVRKIKKQISIEGYLKLKKQCPRMSIVTSKLEYLHNTPKYWNGKEKKEDVYLTIKNWIRRDNSQ